MKFHIIAIGRARGVLVDVYQDYAKRMTSPLILKEIEVKPATSDKEAVALMAALPSGARLIVCDERGKNPSSADFAAMIRRWQDEGVRDVAFLLGGADGHLESTRQRADFLLSFGSLTWPHQLARVMLAEQIYRAQQIIAGHPYHRA